MPIGAAIIGLGFVGKAHLEALRRLGIPVREILGSSRERTAEAVRELNSDCGYASIDELVGDRSVQVVHLCTPNYLHHQQTQALMAAGKHVMYEKPLAMNTRESSGLVVGRPPPRTQPRDYQGPLHHESRGAMTCRLPRRSRGSPGYAPFRPSKPATPRCSSWRPFSRVRGRHWVALP
jgi:hypothetical protein